MNIHIHPTTGARTVKPTVSELRTIAKAKTLLAEIAHQVNDEAAEAAVEEITKVQASYPLPTKKKD